MIALSFPAELYSERAIADAAQAFGDVAVCVVEPAADHFVVHVTATTELDEQLLADELGNYVLGRTIERRGR